MLAAIAPAITGERHWLTVDGPRSRSLAASGEVVHTIPTFDLDHFNLANPFRSVLLALRLRPRLVVTTGAGVVFTFTLISWLLGAQVVFVETMARVSAPSKTGAALARLAKLHIVQWPELMSRFPRAKLCRPALLPDHVELTEGGSGTFVSLGTHTAPFERLIDAVEAAVAAGDLPEPCVVQGESPRPPSNIVFVNGLSPTDFQSYVRSSRYVVGHAGAGFVSTALAQGRRPIVLPRLSARGEHVDDHQVQLARKLARLGLVVNAEEGMSPEAIAAADAPLAYDDVFGGLPVATELISEFLSSAGAASRR